MARNRKPTEEQDSLLQPKDSEEYFRGLVERSPDTLFRFRVFPNEGYDFLGPAVKQFSGYDPEEFYQDWTLIFRLVHPDDLPSLMKHFATQKVSDESYTLRWIRKDGTTVWTEQRNVPIYDQGGKLVAVEGVMREITEEVLRTREREAILSLVTGLRDSVTRAEIAPVLLDVTLALVQADGVALTTGETENPPENAGERCVKVELASGCWKGWTGSDLELGDELYQLLVVERRPYENPTLGDDLPGLPAGWKEELNSLVSVPLVAQGETMGILWVGRRQELARDETLEGQLRVLTAIADIAASALHTAMLFEVTQQRVNHLTALRTIDRAITSSLDLHLTLNVLLDQLMIQKDIDAVDILLVDTFTHQIHYAGGRGLRGRLFDDYPLSMGESLAGQVVLERKAIDLPDLRVYPRNYPQRDLFLGLGLTSYLGVPLITKGEVLGVLEILSRVAKPADQEWMGFIESMAGQVAIAINNAQLFEKLQRTNQDILQSYDATIESWTRAMECRKIEDHGHTDRVVAWSMALGQDLGLGDNELVHLRRGAVLHDIGKLALPDSILLKPGPLNGEELILMRSHPVYSYEWLSPVIYLHGAIDVPYCHHESWDGNGYPRGLKGLQIPFSARIFSVIDAWDALCSDRPYRKAWKRSQALQYIRDMSGVRFDPQVVEAFLRLASQQPSEPALEQF